MAPREVSAALIRSWPTLKGETIAWEVLKGDKSEEAAVSPE